jgi:alanine dehydrogenase
VAAGHRVGIETQAGEGAGFADALYSAAGAALTDAATAWGADLVVKVKEPLTSEYGYLRGQILFTYLHLAGADPGLTAALLSSRTTALAYETLEDEKGRLPLLAPMSAIAGNMSITMGCYYLAHFNNGRGTQLGQVIGRPYGKVVVLGDGVVGRHAARAAHGLGTAVVMTTLKPERSAAILSECGSGIRIVPSTLEQIAAELPDCDLLVGAVLSPGARAPHLVSAEMVASMRKGTVVVDVSIDQGGCIATARPTSHSDPIYVAHGVTHYCVTNMPGAYPRTATLALTQATLPYVRLLADQWADQGIDAVRGKEGFAKAVNTYAGAITYLAVATNLGRMAQYREF